MLTRAHLTNEQHDAIARLYEYDHTILVASKGFGKACVAQTAAQELLDDGVLERVLVVAPPKVCNLTWAQEHTKWSHLREVGVATGDARQRLRVLRETRFDIVVVSADNLAAVFDTLRAEDVWFDGLLIDELTRFKAVGGKHYKALRRWLHKFKWRVGMSATPVAESGIDAYSQALLIDRGRALGTRKDKFLRTYFVPDYSGYNWEYQCGGEQRLAAALASIMWIAPDTDYQASLPPVSEEVVPVTIPASGMRAYEELAQTMILEAEDIEAVNAAVLAGKLQQVASGFIYDAGGDAVLLHRAKMDAVVRLRRQLRQPVIIVYQFREELRALRETFAAFGYHVAVLGDNPVAAERAWNAGELDILLMHPRSGGHGLNLQDGGCTLIQMAPIWSADQSDQVLGRVWRRGQKNAVTRYTLVGQDTIDGVILDRLSDKQASESVLMRHLKQVVS